MLGKEVSVNYSKRFLRQLGRLPKHLVDQAQEKENIFKANPFDSRLNTHKLHGKDKNSWSFSITHKYRIKFIFLNDSTVLFLEVGTHDIYQ
ncbi:MAG: type II toxin-antitoxin system mRNA interferase toxin, RelE/StbE family [bacterium]|nr:type II toxin-antitoxin system mRNA interferase toxin, RelE/StbE family [bacterium]